MFLKSACFLTLMTIAKLLYALEAALVNPSLDELTQQALLNHPHQARYISAYMKMNYSNINRYQTIISKCIKKNDSPAGCTNLVFLNPNRTEEQWAKEPVKSMTIIDGIITIIPNTALLKFLDESDTIVVTPTYANQQITWTYSGGLFNPHPHITNSIDYCPTPDSLPDTITSSQYINNANQEWYLSISATGKPIEAIKKTDLSFVWATTQRVQTNKIACVYRINNNQRPFYITLYSENQLAKPPTGGLWDKESPGLCQKNDSDNFDIKECSFHLR